MTDSLSTYFAGYMLNLNFTYRSRTTSAINILKPLLAPRVRVFINKQQQRLSSFHGINDSPGAAKYCDTIIFRIKFVS